MSNKKIEQLHRVLRCSQNSEKNLRKDVARYSAEVEMLGEIVLAFYTSYSSEEGMAYDEYRAAEDWLTEQGMIPAVTTEATVSNQATIAPF